MSVWTSVPTPTLTPTPTAITTPFIQNLFIFTAPFTIPWFMRKVFHVDEHKSNVILCDKWNCRRVLNGNRVLLSNSYSINERSVGGEVLTMNTLKDSFYFWTFIPFNPDTTRIAPWYSSGRIVWDDVIKQFVFNRQNSQHRWTFLTHGFAQMIF